MEAGASVGSTSSGASPPPQAARASIRDSKAAARMGIRRMGCDAKWKVTLCMSMWGPLQQKVSDC